MTSPNDFIEEKIPFPLNGEAKRERNHSQVEEDMMCGMGSCRPAALQVCARMGAFTGTYSLNALVTSILSVYIISQITTIEKQFGFNSSQSGFLMSCNDIGFLLTTLLFSYFARKAHIPRTLWGCTVMYGISGVVCSLAYFIAKDLILEQSHHLTDIVKHTRNSSAENLSLPVVQIARTTPMCLLQTNPYKLDQNGTADGECEELQGELGVGRPNRFSKAALGLIALGMILQGVAKAPRLPFLATYVDDNVKKKNTAMYMGKQALLL